jgi:hypothetical protein
VTALTDRLANRNISLVIAIDDENALPPINTVNQLIDAIARSSKPRAHELGEKDPRFKAVIDKRIELASTTPEDRRAELGGLIEQLVDSEKLGAADYKKVAEIVYRGHIGGTARKLKKLFPDGFRALSFSEWEQSYVDILKGTSKQARVLLLVDERNELENTVTELNGRALLAKLWIEHTGTMELVDTIIITSICQPDGEFEESKNLLHALRASIEDPSIRAKVRRAFVLSKTRLTDASIDKHFEIHLERIAAAELRSELADLTKQILQKAISDSMQWLEDIPLSEFHGSVFVSSQNEGSAELDTLLRLASIKQRTELEKEFASTGALQKKIDEMRRFSLKHLDPAYAKASRGELRQLRQQEFERSGKLLAAMLTPLSCGDVFELTKTQGGKSEQRLAVLLANPCDLTLRSNGRRKAKRGWMVPLRKDTRSNLQQVIHASGDGSTLLYTLYTGTEDSDVGYLFTNSAVDAIDLDILDLCWSNAEGRAIFDPTALGGLNEFVLPAQKARIKLLARRAAAGPFRELELFATEYPAASSKVAKTTVDDYELDERTEYPIVRVFQLAPEFAAAALSSLSQSISRPAFGHDFVRVSE